MKNWALLVNMFLLVRRSKGRRFLPRLSSTKPGMRVMSGLMLIHPYLFLSLRCNGGSSGTSHGERCVSERKIRELIVDCFS